VSYNFQRWERFWWTYCIQAFLHCKRRNWECLQVALASTNWRSKRTANGKIQWMCREIFVLLLICQYSSLPALLLVEKATVNWSSLKNRFSFMEIIIYVGRIHADWRKVPWKRYHSAFHRHISWAWCKKLHCIRYARCNVSRSRGYPFTGSMWWNGETVCGDWYLVEWWWITEYHSQGGALFNSRCQRYLVVFLVWINVSSFVFKWLQASVAHHSFQACKVMVFSETAYFRYTAVSDPYLKSSPFTECFLHYDHVNAQLKKFLQICLGVFKRFWQKINFSSSQHRGICQLSVNIANPQRFRIQT